MTELSKLAPSFRNELKRITLGDVSNRNSQQVKNDTSAKIIPSPQPTKLQKERGVWVYQYVICEAAPAPVCCVRPDQTIFGLFATVWDALRKLKSHPLCFTANAQTFSWLITDRETHYQIDLGNGKITDPISFESISAALKTCQGVGSSIQLIFRGVPVRLKLGRVFKNHGLANACPKHFASEGEMLYMHKIEVASFFHHRPPIGLRTLDEMYPMLSFHLFGTKDHPRQPSNVFLFQPGRKNHHAFVSAGCRIAWIPEKARSVEELFGGLELVFSYPLTPDQKQMPHSSTVFPKLQHMRSGGVTRMNKANAQNKGYLHFEDVPASKQGHFAVAFPKTTREYTASIAGCGGWMRYKDGNLQICRGKSLTPSTSSLVGFLNPMKSYEPEPSSVVCEIGHKFTSLQELFCAVESMW